MPQTFVKRSSIAASADEVFRWHMRPAALPDLTPPWERIEILERTGGIDTIGSRVVLRMGRRPLRMTWVAEHTHYEPGRMFRDVQVSGPFARWEHTHTVEPAGPDSCHLEDRVVYALPFEPFSRFLAGWFVRRKLDRMFDYRHDVTRQAFAARSTGSRA